MKRSVTPEGGMHPQWEKFCLEYLKDFNQTAAAIRAGYTAESAAKRGSLLIQRPEVQARIRAISEALLRRQEVTVESIVEEARRVAFADIRAVAEVRGGSVRVRDSAEWSDETASAVESVTETPTKHGSSLRVKLNNKLAALELLAKYKDIFPRTGSKNEPLEIIMRNE
jgi:phage terminase small subunit